LLSIPAQDRYPPLQLTPQQQRRHLLEALEKQVRLLAGRAPVVMVFEDLQWMDPSTLELTERLIQRKASLPVLLIATCRPDFVPPWGLHPHMALMTVPRLSRNDSGLLVQALSSRSTLAEGIRQQILDHSDGVPLFLEELTKASLEAAHEHEERAGSANT